MCTRTERSSSSEQEQTYSKSSQEEKLAKQTEKSLCAERNKATGTSCWRMSRILKVRFKRALAKFPQEVYWRLPVWAETATWCGKPTTLEAEARKVCGRSMMNVSCVHAFVHISTWSHGQDVELDRCLVLPKNHHSNCTEELPHIQRNLSHSLRHTLTARVSNAN